MAETFVHRVWKNGTITLILILTLHLSLSSFFKPKASLLNAAELTPEYEAPGKKVIYMLFDALREDFVEWPNGEQPYLDTSENYAYRG